MRKEITSHRGMVSRDVNRVGLVGFGSNGSGPSRVEAKNNIPEPDPIWTRVSRVRVKSGRVKSGRVKSGSGLSNLQNHIILFLKLSS